MSPEEITQEHGQGRILNQDALGWLVSEGVPPLALVRTRADDRDMILMDEIAFLEGGFFEFARCATHADPVPAITILARDEAGEEADIIAFQPHLRRVARLLGRVAVLGQEELYAPRMGQPLPVHPDPVSWLRHRRDGIVVLDARQASWLLRGSGDLLAVGDNQMAAVSHGSALRAALTIPPPRILIPNIAEAA